MLFYYRGDLRQLYRHVWQMPEGYGAALVRTRVEVGVETDYFLCPNLELEKKYVVEALPTSKQ